jgi:cell wall assembly regulator SMI1
MNNRPLMLGGNMREIWLQIDSWLASNAPVVLASLQPGADDGAIRDAESLLGVSFPNNVRESYRIHDGQRAERVSHPLLDDGWELLSLQGMVAHWKSWASALDKGVFQNAAARPQPPIQGNWWHPAWIPVATCHTGSNICLDLAPSEKGHYGQLIAVLHDDPARHLVAGGWSEWLTHFLHDLHRGMYFYSDDHAGLIRVDGVHV